MFIQLKLLKSDEESIKKIKNLLDIYGAKLDPWIPYDVDDLLKKVSKETSAEDIESLTGHFEEYKRDKKNSYKVTLRNWNNAEALCESLLSTDFEEIVSRRDFTIEHDVFPVALAKPILKPPFTLEAR